ncbi:MAG TPA: hypothetical protein VKX17_14735 [Planctomycetota bacterium]|nr:hypothetical protein [Planctomycetota bacterium]
MRQTSPAAAYKRREIPGQMLLDFTATPPPAPAGGADILVCPADRNVCPTDTTTVPAVAEMPLGDAFSDLLGIKNSGKHGHQHPPPLPAELNRLAASAPPKTIGSFITDTRAKELLEIAARELRPGEITSVRVRFFPFRATLYSFKMERTGRAIVKFHLAFRRAGDDVILQAARLMLCRSRRTRQCLHRAEYDQFVRSLPHTEFKLPGARKTKKMSYGSKGVHHQLDESFQRVNAAYFESRLVQPELCWSPVRARRILGSYQERNDRLIVSRVFDSAAVPLFVLDYLMYHELLHKFLGVGRRGDGKRCMHGPEFKELERRYARYDEAIEFIKKL